MVAVVVLLALVLSSVGGIVLVPAVLRLAPAKALPRARAADLLRGGLVIGVLERFAITGALLAGRPEAVAVVLAIKGLGRYPELRNAAGAAPDPTPGDPAQPGPGPSSAGQTDPDIGAAVSERFIIGTLASNVWAGACGILGLWGMTLLS